MCSRLRGGLLVLVGLWLCAVGNAQRTKDKMFSPIDGASCIRRLNGTHETGCTSKFGGSVGVLHLVRTAADFAFVSDNPPSPPYTLVVTPDLFTRANILPLKSNPHVAGVVLIKNDTLTTPFSQELQCPNQYSSYNNASCSAAKPESLWNRFGTGLLHESFQFPIYFIEDPEEVRKITQCFEKFNAFDLPGQSQRSLCSIQINQLMSASVSSEVCLRRSMYEVNVTPTRFCDPLTGKNVYATLYPREELAPGEPRKVQPDEKFILVTARMDTTSMFDGIGLGSTELLSLATLISTAHILSSLLPERRLSNHSNVMFALFNGEAYDYIGSQSFVDSAARGAFPPSGDKRHPIALENIELIIDVGNLDDPHNLNVYHTSDFQKAKDLVRMLELYNRAHSFNVATVDTVTDDLPPTSTQSFLRHNRTYPAVVLQSSPTSTGANRYYHSIFDDAENIRFRYQNTSADFRQLTAIGELDPHFDVDSVQMAVRNVSSVLAFTLFQLVSEKAYTGTMGGSAVLVDEILYCYLESLNCPLFAATLSPSAATPPSTPPSRYISVQGLSLAALLTYNALGYLASQPTELAQDNCTHLPYVWYTGWNGTGECRLTTQNKTNAVSPAFLIDDYDFTSGRYSTWTESTWSELSARIFLKPSASHEALTLAIGFVVMTAAFVFVFLVNSRSDVLFGEATIVHVASPLASVAPVQC